MPSPWEEFYQTIHHLTGRVLPAAQFRVNLLDEATNDIVSVYCVDEENCIPKRRPLGKGMVEYTMRLGHAVHITPELLHQLIETGEYTLWKMQNKNARQSLCAPLIDSKGKPFGMISLISTSAESFFKAIDVETLSIIAAQISMAIEYKRIKAELVAERNLFKAVIDKIPDRIFVKDRQSRFILNNIAHIKALGANSQSEVLGKTRHDFRPAGFADRQLADRHLADDRIVMENDKPLTREEPTILPSGETGALFVSKIPLHNEDGEVIGLIGFNRDISESKRAKQALRCVAGE
ncbi:MAG: PAS domain-containing protein [Negativicutes bacterium]